MFLSSTQTRIKRRSLYFVMSTPSPNDGNSSEEFYRGGINPNIPQPPQIPQYVSGLGIPQTSVAAGQHQAQPPPPPQFVHWPNPLIGGTPFMQQHHPPQQLFNDVLFNIQAQAAYAASVPQTPAPQQETYSVLRVGNGNFLKIYHCPENAMGPLPGETSFAPLHHPPPFNPQQTQQAAAYHHIQQQPTSVQATPQQQHSQGQQQTPSHLAPNSNTGTNAPQIYNSYELFSSNTFTQLPTAEMPPVLVLGTSNNIRDEQPINVSEEYVETELQVSQTMLEGNNTVDNVSNNWLENSIAPPLYEQFENSQTIQSETEYLAHMELELPKNANVINTENSDKNVDAANYIAIQPQQQQITQINTPIKVQSSKDKHQIIQSPLTHKSEIPRQEAPKKRIVAEVKPMRMTYSDVLSKINNQTQQNASNYVANNQNSSLNALIRNQQKSSGKSSSSSSSSADNNGRRSLEEFASNRSSKKSPTHDNKENQQHLTPQQQQQLNKNMNKRSSANVGNTMVGNGNNGSNYKNPTVTSTVQKNIINNLKSSVNDLQQQQTQPQTQQQQQQPQNLQKKRVNKNVDTQVNGGESKYIICT